MKRLSFTNFLKEKANFLVSPNPRKGYAFFYGLKPHQKLDFVRHLFLVVILLFLYQFMHAQTTFTACNGLFFDDGGAGSKYIEDQSEVAISEVFSVCPINPATQVVFVEFMEFNIAEGDQMLAYDGMLELPESQITTALGGEGHGPSISNAPGGGWVAASCENTSGCVTFVFNRNNDGVAGTGWTFSASCVNRESYSFPAAGTNTRITSADDVCSPDGLVGVSVDIPDYSDCDGNDLIISTDCPIATITPISSSTILVNAPVGTTVVSFSSPLFPSQVATTTIRTLPIPLTCNRDLEVSLSGDCVVPLTPDMILEDACMSPNYTYDISFIDPNRDDFTDPAVIGMTAEGYPIVDFSGVPCGTQLNVLVERTYNVICGEEQELPSACIGQIVIADRVDPEIEGNLVDDYVIPCYFDTDALLDQLNASTMNGGGTTINLQPTGVNGMTDIYDLSFTIDPVSTVFEISDNCAATFEVSEWQFVELDCTTDRFDPYGTFDHDNDPNTPEIPVSQDPLWALMAVEVEDPNGTGGTPAIFRCYFRRIQAVDDCGNESNLAIQRVCIAQPDIVFPLVEVEIPCGVSTDPIDIYNLWASDPDRFEEFATFIPVYDPTPLDLNGDFSLFGNLEDTYFTDASGDEVPVFPEDGACGYAIDWLDSEPIEVCEEAFKIFREWTVFNFCDGHLEIIDLVPQVLKVGDVAPPQVEFLGITGTGSPYADCVADALIQLDIQDDCSDEFQVFIDFFNDDQPEVIAEFSEGGVLVPNVVIGEEFFFTVRVVDECWNGETFGPFVGILKDNIPPVAICESFRTVSMGVDCEVIVPAEAFDDGSYDNCGQLSYSVARMDEIGDFLFDESFDFLFEGDQDVFQPTVSFSKADLIDCSGTVSVVFRVEDGSGNSNFCMVEVELQDKLPPVVQDKDLVFHCDDHAVKNIVIAAFADDPNLAIQEVLNSGNTFSDADSVAYIHVVNDNCDNSTFIVDFVDVSNYDKTCRQGLIQIFYQAVDACGNISAPSVANITLKNKSDWTMNFPLDLEIFCEEEAGVPAPTSIEDILDNKGCDFWGLEVNEEFFDSEGACSKIVREYHLINWCTWHPNNTEIAVVERPQEIILDPFYTVTLRYQDRFINGLDIEEADGINDLDDGNEDGDDDYIYLSTDDRLSRFAPIRIPFSNSQLDRINDFDEAENTDPYDVTDFDFDADFVVIDFTDFAYQNISTFPAISQFSSVEEHYVSAQQYGNILYRQIIKINDIAAPVVDVTQSGPFCGGDTDPGEGGICTGQVDLKFSVSDLCSPKINIHYELIAFVGTADEVVITDDPFGSLLEDQGDFKISGFYPIGNHQIVLKAEDACANVGKAFIDFEVKDCKAPVLTCFYGLATDLMVNGKVTLSADEFLNQAEDFCSEVEIFFANPEIYPDSTERMFRCIDGEVGIVAIEIWARDEAGNTAFCETFVNVQQNPQDGDTPDNCPTVGSMIAGTIQTSNEQTVEGVAVQMSGTVEDQKYTGKGGSYHFVGLSEGFDYSIKPYKNDDALNGVTTLDIVLISKHILGIELLADPYQLIAADVNNSGSITTFDMVNLRRLILGMDQELQNNTSWRFIPKDFQFEDPMNPFQTAFPELMNINDLGSDYMDSDFVAIKTGDINGSAIANTNSVEGRTIQETFYLEAEDQDLVSGENYRIPFYANAAQIQAYQFTMNWSGIEVLAIEDGWMQATHFAQFNNYLTASWDKTENIAQEEAAFTLIVRAKENTKLRQAIELTSDLTSAIAYDQAAQPMNVGLQFEQGIYELMQNKPNPFSESTTIGFQIPAAQTARLTVHDLNGKVVYTTTQALEAGYNEIILSRNDLPTGMLYYTLESANFVATRKMIVLGSQE
ncbi:MAG: T9SS type A sorting domain-containing protein [Bacteroidota bacterium]